MRVAGFFYTGPDASAGSSLKTVLFSSGQSFPGASREVGEMQARNGSQREKTKGKKKKKKTA